MPTTLDPSRLAAPAEPAALLVRPQEAARLLSLSRTMLYQLLTTGEIASLKVGSARLIAVDALRDWIARQQDDGGAA